MKNFTNESIYQFLLHIRSQTAFAKSPTSYCLHREGLATRQMLIDFARTLRISPRRIEAAIFSLAKKNRISIGEAYGTEVYWIK